MGRRAENSLPRDTLKKDVEHLKEWLSKQAHMPDIDDEDWLLTFMHHAKYSLERTKNKLDKYFSLRNKYPHLLKNRDPASREIVEDSVAWNFCCADRLTKDGNRLIFTKPNPDSSLFSIDNHLKKMSMVLDMMYLENDRHSHCILITDQSTMSYEHVLKALPSLRFGPEIFFGAYPHRIKAVHVLNAPSYARRATDMFKAILPRKLAERFYMHTSPDSLCKMVDEQVLCSDFGGKGPSLATYNEHTRKTLEKHRDWFLRQDDICTNESLRIIYESSPEEMIGSFRKLEVD